MKASRTFLALPVLIFVHVLIRFAAEPEFRISDVPTVAEAEPMAVSIPAQRHPGKVLLLTEE